MNEKIIAVAGPTASGKSALALALAEELGGEIVSCDSMQIYRRMNIGTAKPTADELARVPHHLIDVCEPDEDFSCADYVSLATRAIEEISSRGKLPIVCGGTGLYLDALLRKNDLAPDTVDEDLRAELWARYEREGADALWRELYEIDRESAEATHPNNVKRVLRAIEIYRTAGITKTELDRRSLEGGMRYDACVLYLSYENREQLYERINARVDIMIDDGLVEETAALRAEGVFEKNRTAAQAIGYKEILPYLDGHVSLAEAAEDLKTATRRYAKRQITWFSAKPYARPLTVSGETTQKNLLKNASELFQNF
ncbi:MAG: tRNA (adenosine(37)-N6)-dimethylallyltransferase MiaA [Clostridia bacterium]|nr:tRNA (adenosine(37)-N6)-dimethylallyltransferase MiaA [Clostridia bacterium]